MNEWCIVKVHEVVKSAPKIEIHCATLLTSYRNSSSSRFPSLKLTHLGIHHNKWLRIAWAKFGRNGKEKTAEIRSYKTDRTADQTLLEIATQQSKLITPRACLSNCRPVRYPPTPSLSLPATRAFPICLVPAQTGSRATRVAFHSRSDPPRSGSRIPHATLRTLFEFFFKKATTPGQHSQGTEQRAMCA